MDEINRRNINAKLLMLKCDGTVVGLKEALEKPVESIFSGPAASLVGASYLSGCDTCAVIDVGGTSTDVSAVYDGVPELTDAGAMVGDSHVWTRSKRYSSVQGGSFRSALLLPYILLSWRSCKRV